MKTLPPPCKTLLALFLAFLGAIVAVYVEAVVGLSIRAPYHGPLSIFVWFPLIGAIFVVPFCIVLTLVAWACFTLAHRWIQSSRAWANVVAVVLTVVTSSALYVLLALTSMPTMLKPHELLIFGLAVFMVVAVCVVGGVGRHREDTFEPALQK